MSIDSEFAFTIAEEMRSSQVPRTWRKVTTILSAYGRYKLTQDARRQIEADFDEAGLVTMPSMLTVDRAARVRLTLKEKADELQAHTGFDGSLPAGVTLWANRDGRWRNTQPQAGTGELLLVDIDMSVVGDSGLVLDCLDGRLVGLDEETLQDLVTPDSHAKFKKTSSEIRRASLFVASSDPDEPVSSDKAIPLSLRLVEFAFGRDWLVMARHPSQLYVSGSAHVSTGPAQTADQYIASLLECELDKATSAQEAALAIITHGLDSFSRIRTVLASYLESWRTEFAAGSLDKTVLVELQATLPLVVDAIEPLLHPSVAAWVKATWTRDAVALSDQMLRNLDALRGLQGTTAAAIAQADQAQNEKYQRSLATLAAVFLAPALVASVFGANQLLEDSTRDLLWLVLAMVLTGAVTQLAIGRVLRPRTVPATVTSAGHGASVWSGWRPRRRHPAPQTKHEGRPQPVTPLTLPPAP